MLKNNSNFIKLWKNINTSISRRLKLLSFIGIDLLFLNLLILLNKNNQFDMIINFYFILFWIIYSYFFGRYYIKYNSLNDLLFKSILMSILIIFITVISIFILNYLFYFLNLNYIVYRFNLSLILIISIISNCFILLINTNRASGNQIWLIFNDKKKIFQKLKLISEESNNANFVPLNDLRSINIYDDNYNGIIICNMYELDINTINNLLNLEKQGVVITNPILWCKTNLLRLPVEIIMNTNSYFSFNKVQISIFSRIKRIFDIVFSSFLFLLTIPIVLLSCLLIFIEDKGPVFYSQKRTGYKGKEFKIWKIRSMKNNSEPNGPVWTLRHDNRTLKIGRILRNTRIDELPQLLSVISGDMSLIGPRPERPEMEIDLIKNLPNYMYRYQVKPGLSGWAQINYPYGASFEDSKNKLSYDFFYILEYSFLLDIMIFIKTIRIIFKGSGSKPN